MKAPVHEGECLPVGAVGLGRCRVCGRDPHVVAVLVEGILSLAGHAPEPRGMSIMERVVSNHECTFVPLSGAKQARLRWCEWCRGSGFSPELVLDNLCIVPQAPRPLEFVGVVEGLGLQALDVRVALLHARAAAAPARIRDGWITRRWCGWTPPSHICKLLDWCTKQQRVVSGRRGGGARIRSRLVLVGERRRGERRRFGDVDVDVEEEAGGGLGVGRKGS